MAAVAEIAAAPRDRIWDEISEMGLEKYVADMDHDGFCTLPPEIANPNNLAERMLDALVDLAEKRNGERPICKPARRMPINPNFFTVQERAVRPVPVERPDAALKSPRTW